MFGMSKWIEAVFVGWLASRWDHLASPSPIDGQIDRSDTILGGALSDIINGVIFTKISHAVLCFTISEHLREWRSNNIFLRETEQLLIYCGGDSSWFAMKCVNKRKFLYRAVCIAFWLIRYEYAIHRSMSITCIYISVDGYKNWQVSNWARLQWCIETRRFVVRQWSANGNHIVYATGIDNSIVASEQK